MIERAITENDIVSEYYRKHELVAKSWENFAKKNSGEIEGIVNSYIVEAKLLFVRKERHISIDIIRQLTHGTGISNLLIEIPVIQNTRIEIKPLRLPEENWKIKKKSKTRDLFFSIFKKYIAYCHDNSYTLVSKLRVNQMRVLDAKTWQEIRKVSELVEISYVGNALKIEYLNMISPESIEVILEILIDKYGI